MNLFKFPLKNLIFRKFLYGGYYIAGMSSITSNVPTDKKVKFETLSFDNLALRSLPIDPQAKNYVREVRGACFSRVKPAPVKTPKLVIYSESAMKLLDLDKEELERADAAEYFSGNKLLPDSDPAAHCYCGHQFGNFSGQLGDGATMYLGEIINKNNERWEIQFKGAGPTPYSRSADGRKVLRSSLREFLCSEAMFHLGIPTTRAGTCVTSESTVVRDIFYDGNPIMERCTIILRIAPTFIRFGSFEIFKPIDPITQRRGPSVGLHNILIQLTNYVIDTFYPEIASHYQETTSEDKYLEFFEEVVKRTARLVAEWQAVGWCHGVLNTDNMSIVGVTIDYGPFGFLDRYDPNHVCNGSDTGARYSYKNQPSICRWNCSKLAEALNPILPLARSRKALELFDEFYETHYLNKMRRKMGLSKELDTDKELIEEFLQIMYDTGADFTNSFRNLNKLVFSNDVTRVNENQLEKCLDIYMTFCCGLNELKELNKPKFPKETLLKLATLLPEQEEILQYMGFSGDMIRSELDKVSKFEEIKNMTGEQKRQNDRQIWSKWFQKYIERVKHDSADVEDKNEYIRKRVQILNSNNPRFILRNHIVQNAIEKAEKNDFYEARALLKLLENPYSEEPVEKLVSQIFKSHKCVDWQRETLFYENRPTPEQSRIIVT